MDNTERRYRLPWIDALRGYAILGVILVHSGIMFPAYPIATRWGQTGVDLFFAVSAFTVAQAWEKRHEPVWAFYLRRLFRIVPMYWVALVFYLAWSAVGLPVLGDHRVYAFWQVILTGALLQGLHPSALNYVVPGNWSISAELAFYIVFPPLFALITTARRAVLFSSIAATVSLSIGAFAFPLDARLREFILISPAAHFVAFAGGLLVYRSQVVAKNYLLPLAILWLAALCCYGSISPTGFSIGFALIMLAMVGGAGRFLVFPMIRHLGKISYSVYLLHFAIIDVATKAIKTVFPGNSVLLNLVILVSAVLLVSFGVCTVTYESIERRMIRFGARTIGRLLAQFAENRLGNTAEMDVSKGDQLKASGAAVAGND